MLLTEMMTDGNPTVVLDHGTASIKAGLAGQFKPHVFLPTLVGRPAFPQHQSIGVCCGEKALKNWRELKITYPIVEGTITDWDDMEVIWNHIFHEELKIQPDEHAYLLTERPRNPRQAREKTAEIFFEKFSAQAVYLAIESVLSLYTSGRTVGMVLNCGEGASHAVPVYEGYALPLSWKRVSVAGTHLTDYLITLLEKKGHSFKSPVEREIAGRIKEEMCYVAMDVQQEAEAAPTNWLLPQKYVLPNGDTIKVDHERYQVPEPLFHPPILDIMDEGLPEAVVTCAKRCDVDIRDTFYKNVVLTGGGSQFPGMAARMQSELEAITPSNTKIRVLDPKYRGHAVWLGGSIMGSLSTFKSICVDRQQYKEYGPEIIHQKCF
ncbi:PREDICTED: actin-3-like [Branchiostoma belcheri]|uniref:Actin-3-like n=1 Tax=Branchiostoma belcheri TaxID=7741 RepID=A0A6P4Z7F9_BRABE|nr:PREDICTED: actin-3-like [Branchiostoma belcheri]XP_019637345.1 PREDICTED: actin-3-like [Branchiostoma belcheri]